MGDSAKLRIMNLLDKLSEDEQNDLAWFLENLEDIEILFSQGNVEYNQLPDIISDGKKEKDKKIAMLAAYKLVNGGKRN